ncbi:toll-like receptor 4 [Haliotis cracherodii]|uniref:toll-like receptor 4 n=1 Tax=Haliotis cracherodii TaxID=6455 RepID=UPI0039E9B928
MSHNSISRIVKRFLHLPNLKYLDLSFNIIKILEEGSFLEAADLEELYLNNNELRLDSTTYPDDVFQPLQKLQMLHLHNNDHRYEGTYPERAIAKLKHVQELKIDTFTYTNFGPGFSELTNTFSMTQESTKQKLVEICAISLPTFGLTLPETLVYLTLSENQHGLKLFLKDRDTIPGGQIAEDIIDGIDSSWNVILALSQSFLEDQWCRFIVNRVVYSSSRMPAGSIVLVLFEDVRRADIPPTLLNVVEEKQIFDMEKYRGEEGKLWKDVFQLYQLDVFFMNASYLEYANFAYNGFNEIHKVFGLTNLSELDVSGNPLGGIVDYSFDNLPSLTYLNMTNSGLGKPEFYLLENGRRLLRPLRRLRSIILDDNGLVSFDKHMFVDKPLETIDLSRNRFKSIPFDLTSTPYLCYLDLSHNSVVDLSIMEMSLLDNLAFKHNLTLNLQGNLLSCGCQNQDFILWLSNTKVNLVPSSTYACLREDGTLSNTTYYVDNYEKIWRMCYGRLMLAGTVSGFAVTILIMVGMYVVVAKQTLLVNIVLRLFGYKTTVRPLKRLDFPYDAYIGYSDCNYQYICHTMREHLEDRLGVKLFLKDRDTIPGGQIADDIINGIDSSWKTLLILTQSFVEDQWCRFIVNRTVYSSSRMPVGSILLVLFEDVRRGDISPALLNVVEERHIFCVGRYRDDEERLWKEISQCIKMDED